MMDQLIPSRRDLSSLTLSRFIPVLSDLPLAAQLVYQRLVDS